MQSLSHLEASLESLLVLAQECILPWSDVHTYLLLQLHDLESLEIAQLLPPDASFSALGERAVLPLGLHIMCLPLLLQSSTSDRSWEIRDHDAGEGHV